MGPPLPRPIGPYKTPWSTIELCGIYSPPSPIGPHRDKDKAHTPPFPRPPHPSPPGYYGMDDGRQKDRRWTKDRWRWGRAGALSLSLSPTPGLFLGLLPPSQAAAALIRPHGTHWHAHLSACFPPKFLHLPRYGISPGFPLFPTNLLHFPLFPSFFSKFPSNFTYFFPSPP